MKYITSEDVQNLTKGPKSALDVSLVHWYQNWKGVKENVSCRACYCGLCTYYHKKDPLKGCDKCPFVKYMYKWFYAFEVLNRKYLNLKEWRKEARSVFYALIKISSYDNTKDFLTRLPQRYCKFIE